MKATPRNPCSSTHRRIRLSAIIALGGALGIAAQSASADCFDDFDIYCGSLLRFDTSLTSFNLSGGPFLMPLASDPDNLIVGTVGVDATIDGFGFVLSQVTISLSSRHGGPASLGTAFALVTPEGDVFDSTYNNFLLEYNYLTTGLGNGLGPDFGPTDPDKFHGRPTIVYSKFDVFFDITVTDVDPRPLRNFPGQPDGGSLSLMNNGPASMESIAGLNQNLFFDKSAPDFGLLPPPEGDPYIGHVNIEIPLHGDINGNNEDDKIKFTLVTHSVEGESVQWIVLPDGTRIETFDSGAFIAGAVVDVSTDPPFTIGMIDPITGLPVASSFGGPVTATSRLTTPMSIATWDGELNAGSMATGPNWVRNVAPIAGNRLIFAGQFSTSANNDFAANTLFTGLTFAPSAGTFTVSGNVINLGGDIVDDSHIAQTISAPLALTASRAANVASRFGALTISGVISETGGAGFGFTKSGSGLLTLSGANSFTGPVKVTGGTLAFSSDSATAGAANQLGATPAATTPGAIVLDGGTLRSTATTQLATVRGIALGNSVAATGGTIDVSGGSLTYNGVMANNGGTNSFTKTGANQLTLGGVSTYTGSTFINQGTLKLDFTQLAGTTSNIIHPSSTLVMGGVTTGLGDPFNPSLTSYIGGATLNVTSKSAANSSQTFNGLALNPGAATIRTTQTSGGNVLLNLGAISRNTGSAVNFSPAGALSGVNAITTTTGNDATGILGGWAVHGSSNYAAKDGSGNIVAYTGYTAVGAVGSTVIANSATTNYNISSNAGGALSLGAATTTINTLRQGQATAATTVNLSVGQILRLGANGGILLSAGNHAIQIGQTVGQGTLTAGGADNVAGEINVIGFSSLSTGAGPSQLVINAVIANNGTGAVKITITDLNGGAASNRDILDLTAANTYTGGTIVTSGRVRASNLAAFGMGDVTVINGAEVFLPISGTYTNNFNIGGAGTTYTGSTPSAIRHGSNTIAGIITLLGDGTINSRNSTGGVLSGQIRGGYNLTITGNGALGGNVMVSNTSNNWTGNLILDGKQLLLGNSNVIPNGGSRGNVILSNQATSILDLNGHDETINGLISLGSAPFVQNNLAATTSTLTVGDGGASAIFSGVIRDNSGSGGTVALVKIGSGMQALTSNNSYTGGTIVKVGTLFATAGAGGSAFGSGPITIGSTTGGANAAVQVTNIGRTFTNAITVAAGSSGSRTLQTSGDGQDFVFSGPITLNSSLVVNTFTGNTNTLTLSGAMTGSSPLFVNAGGGTITFSGAITSVPTVTKTGTGKLLIDTVLGSGSTIVNADEGETHFAQSQTLAALYIADGAVVTLADVPPTPPAPDFGDAGLLAPAGDGVPEPGTATLLCGGLMLLLGLRRRRE